MQRADISDDKRDLLIDFFCTQSSIPIIILNEDFVLQKCNDIFKKLFKSKDIVIGKKLEEILTIDEISDFYNEDDSYEIKKISCELKSSAENLTLLNGYIIYGYKFIIIIFEKYMLSEYAIIEQMSNMNIEMSNLARELAKKNSELQKANEKISNLSNTDYLTGAYNRRFFFTKLEEVISLKKRYSYPLVGVIMADIDFFKSFNDTYGHDIGDLVLKNFAARLKSVLREEDVFARVGGEEFCVLVRIEKDEENIQIVAEKLRKACKEIKIENVPKEIKASFGASIYKQDESIDTFMKRVDNALYQAKESGRNRVVLL